MNDFCCLTFKITSYKSGDGVSGSVLALHQPTAPCQVLGFAHLRKMPLIQIDSKRIAMLDLAAHGC